MSLRSVVVLFLVGYVIRSVASFTVCSIHGTSPCPCANAIITANQPTCGNGNPCAQCGGYKPMMYYKPGNDLYSCSTIVKPAYVPETCPCYCHVSPVHDKECDDEPEPVVPNPPACPVDSVSLTLAQSLMDEAKYNIPESKFWFGPTKIPRLDLPKIIRKNVPEERLFAMERDIIELKPVKSKSGWDDSRMSDESSSAESSSSSESDEHSNGIKRTEMTYKEIGYDRIKLNDNSCEKNTFRLLPQILSDVRPSEMMIPSIRSQPFVPGKVILRKRKFKPFASDCNGSESYEDLADRLDTFVGKSRSKFYENLNNRPRVWQHMLMK